MFLIRILTVLAFLTGGASAQNAIFVGNVPLPEDAVTHAPATQDFAGAWVGQWDNQRNHILIVEALGADGSARVIYAVGSDMNAQGRWFRRTAKIEGDTLSFADGGFDARYTLSPTGHLRGVFADNSGFSVLRRQELSDLIAAPDADWFSVGSVERLETDLVEDGQAIELTVVIHRPPGDGPFPLALFHHGSTGTGKHPSEFGRLWTNDWFADVLNENGWLVAFPYRRGRGGSDGLYDEGFAEDRTQGYSPKAALSLPGAERALTDANAALAALLRRPDVAPGPVLLGGVSRGGVVAIMQAGDHPDAVSGVINFVGGWVSENWGDPDINTALFRRIGAFSGPVLSIYGEEDPYYSVAYSKANLAELGPFDSSNQLHVVKVPGYGNGHWAMGLPVLWENTVSKYLKSLE